MAKTPRLPPDVTWDTKAGIHLRLLRARGQLRTEKLWTKFQGNERDYDAFSIHELAEVCERVLADHGVTYAFSVEKVSAAERYRMVEGWAIFICAERDDDDVTREFRVYTVGEGIDESDKGFGKAISYARKSGLIQGMNLAIGRDNEATKERYAAPSTPPPSVKPKAYYVNFGDAGHDVPKDTLLNVVKIHIDKMSTAADVESFRAANASEFDRFWHENGRDLGVALKRTIEQRIATLMTNSDGE